MLRCRYAPRGDSLLVLRAANRFQEASFESTMALERTFAAHHIRRNGLTVDARFIPPSENQSDRMRIFVTAQGDYTFEAPVRERFAGPSAFLLSEDAFEGANGHRTCFFCSTGNPFIGIDFMIKRSDVPISVTTGPIRLDLRARAFEIANDIGNTDPKDGESWARQIREVVEELARAGVVKDEIAASVRVGDKGFGRLWTGLVPLAERFYSLSTLDEISSTSGISVRQLRRDMDRFIDAFHFGLGGWRHEMRRLRLKIAALGLSAQGATVADVARAAGYGSTEAMARAFREAGLPAPSAVLAEFAS